MSINLKIFQEIKPFLGDYNCWDNDITDVINFNGSFLGKQRIVIEKIEKIMTAHGKKELFKNIAELARVEHHIQELQPWVRDHVVHAFLTFFLGIYVNEKSLKKRVDPFQWELAGLLHDVGYPIEIANNVAKPFTDNINSIKNSILLNAPNISINIVPVGLEKIQNDINSLDLIQKKLDIWRISVDSNEEYRKMLMSGKICHGIISSLSVLWIIDLIYQKYNPERKYKNICIPNTMICVNQKYFENDVVSACASIFLHNLPIKSFNGKKIDVKHAPLPYMLKLCDIFQEWERPSVNNEFGYSSEKFQITIEDDKIKYKADIDVKRKKEIINELNSILDCSNLEIS